MSFRQCTFYHFVAIYLLTRFGRMARHSVEVLPAKKVDRREDTRWMWAAKYMPNAVKLEFLFALYNESTPELLYLMRVKSANWNAFYLYVQSNCVLTKSKMKQKKICGAKQQRGWFRTDFAVLFMKGFSMCVSKKILIKKQSGCPCFAGCGRDNMHNLGIS